MRDWEAPPSRRGMGMGTKWGHTTDVRPRDWRERTEDSQETEDVTISLADRLETILYLRDVQDLSVPRSYAI